MNCEKHNEEYVWECHKCEIENRVSKSALAPGLDPLFPTREEIEKLAYNNLILYAAMRAKEAAGLSWTETLQFAVKYLIEKNNELQDNMIKRAELSTRPLVIKGRD